MGWNKAKLEQALRRYRVWLESRGLSPNTIHSHHYYGQLFVRWLYGEYAPRSCRPRREPIEATRALTDGDFGGELSRYETFLTDCGLAPGAVRTYMIGAGLFVSWLADVGAEALPEWPAAGEPPRVPPRRPTMGTNPEPTSLGGWPAEAAVQAAVVTWLVGQGWSIERVADTGSREHGVDILARRSGERLAVEVKGYPAEHYVTGERAGQQRRWPAGSQARTYYGDALLAVLRMRDSLPGTRIALALPEVGAYQGLVGQVEQSLVDLGIWVLMVARGGAVRERGATPDR